MSISTSRWARWSLLLSSVCLAAACSSSGGSSASSATSDTAGNQSSTTVSGAGAGGGGGDVTADTATANAINLTADDLGPGWTSTPPDNSKDPIGPQLAKCAGAPDPATTKVVDVSSPNFDQNGAEVSSDVTMVKTTADAQADLQALTSDKLSDCIQSIAAPYLSKSLPAGATLGTITFTKEDPPSGIPDSFAFQLSIPVTASGQSLTVTSVLEGFLVGRAEVGLTDTATSGSPDTSLQSKLMNVLYTRAKAQSGTS